MAEDIRSVRKGTIFFNIVMWTYQLSISFLCLHYKVYLVLAVLIMNFCLSNYNWLVIKKGKYIKVVKITYFELIVFMTAGTVSLGIGYGFYLYGISLITILYYIEYISIRLKTEHINRKFVISVIIASYIVSYIYAETHEPIYVISNIMRGIFFIGNSFLVFGVLIVYMKTNIELIKRNERKLEEIAHVDKLTGLYNRHYMMSYMDEISEKGFNNYWLAILDIDNFKKVNDTYGHNCGDFVLKNVAEITNSMFPDGIVCRWGGEEFIVLASENKIPDSELEILRKKIADTVMSFEDQNIQVSVTVGTKKYSDDLTVDKWISSADAKLYLGKNSGKNKVVY